MKFIFTFSLIIFLIFESKTQNLVPNPGFEEFFSCPQTINNNKSNKKIAPHWYSPSYGTPDLYNTCSPYKMGIQNITGVTNPYKGKGFAGIIIWEEKKGFREYLQIKLIEPLKANKTYQVTFKYKLSTYSKYCADRIGFSITDTSLFYKMDMTLPIPPSYSLIKPKVIDPNTGTWELLEAEFIAKGNEQYLTIGNFYNNNETKAKHLPFANSQEPMLEHAAYYYIDEVSVNEKIDIVAPTQQDTITPTIDNKPVNLKENYILENVLFKYNSDSLLENSYDELNEVITILNTFPEWKVNIFGHTDNKGSIQYNQDLSEKRALAVKHYLILNGISEERIRCKGYGKSQPITTGTDEKSQKTNRRVEVKFLNE